MKRLLSAILAGSVFAVPMVADAKPMFAPGHGPAAHHAAPPHRGPVVRHVVRPRPQAHARWAVGHRVPAAQHRVVIRDYGRYHLRRPGAGQHWIRVDNEFLLVGITSGLIAGFIAAN